MSTDEEMDFSTVELAPDPPDTPENRARMEEQASDSFLVSGGCVNGCSGCPFWPVCYGARNRRARHDFAVSWLLRHAPAAMEAMASK